ncbi:hypothetical protein QVD17_15407 [Tagetes erecta]|uniref:Uncharacterized protein n=1 Tax=Tagetes erecta TaxID=13708 RepID=A0AAD8KSA5_TARER|nr:hypothetical protein QVD17_15407 [Tagetes erecta]
MTLLLASCHDFTFCLALLNFHGVYVCEAPNRRSRKVGEQVGFINLSSGLCVEIAMEQQIEDAACLSSAVKATLCLGSETHSIEGCKGILSEQLVFLKGESMNILKEYITKHNVPNDVPDEISSEEDDDGEDPAVKSKKVRV